MLHGDVADEIASFAHPGRAQPFNDQLRRSGEMIRTGNIANGGSPTAELLSQQGDIGIDPISFGSQLLSGNFGGALKTAAGGFLNGLNGNTEAVRNELIPMLLNGKAGGRSGNVNLDQIVQSLQDQAQNAAQRGVHARRGISSGLVPGAIEELNAPAPVPVRPTVARAGNGYVQQRGAPPAPVVVNRNGRR
jgi:hypothetical protein